MRMFKSEKGEFTVEAVFVFTITFITLILLLYIGMVMYQHVHLQSATDRIASRGAMMYATRTLDMDGDGKTLNSFKECDPYRYIFDGSYKAKAQAKINDELIKELGQANVVKTTEKNPGTAKVQLGIFSRKVVVTGTRKFNVPFLSTFDLDDSLFDINVTSTAYIMDMPETIRNVDYVVDMLQQNEAIDEAMNKVGKVKKSLQECIMKIE